MGPIAHEDTTDFSRRSILSIDENGVNNARITEQMPNGHETNLLAPNPMTLFVAQSM